jgi:hypothetical protein
MLTGRVAVVRSRGLRLCRENGPTSPDDKECEVGDVLTIISEDRGRSRWMYHVLHPVHGVGWVFNGKVDLLPDARVHFTPEEETDED